MAKRSWITFVVSTVFFAGCTALWTNGIALPNKYETVKDQLTIHSDFRVATRHRIFEELCAKRSDLEFLLGMPASDEPVHVYLFEDADRFQQFVQLYYPDVPARRAFFLETDTQLQVYAQWGNYVAEDLRHEVTHGYLHSVVPNIPLWLDEGLAEYFEVARGHNGVNQSHLRLLLDGLDQGTWTPDLARLDTLATNVDMPQEDYAESWAWVHFLLSNGIEGRAFLQHYLMQLRRHGATEPLSIQIDRFLLNANRSLIEHIRHLEAQQEAAPSADHA